MTSDDSERAELIAALSQTTEMVSGLLDLLDRLADSLNVGRRPTAPEIAQLREHSEMWRGQIASLRQRIGAAAIEPPRRVQ